MTPQDHNKTLGIIYGLLGGLLGTVVLVIKLKTFFSEQVPQGREDPFLLTAVPVGLVLALLLLLTAFGLFRRRRWSRILALMMACLFIWLFPLGTLLAIYTWWYMHSEGGKQLYTNATD
jgi:cytochrome bd-type quinol oxidase subunit 1